MELAQGYTGSEKTICIEHVTDAVLRHQVEPDVSELACSFCGRSVRADEPPFAVPLDSIGDRVYEVALWLYDSFDNASVFDNEVYESGLETTDVVWDCVSRAIDPLVVDDVVDTLSEAISTPESWIPARLEDDLTFGWEQFAQTVKHESRFVFIGYSGRPGSDTEPPGRLARFLESVLVYADKQTRMVTTLPAGTPLYRGRMERDARKTRRDIDDELSKNLGPAPIEKAAAGRMQAQGIPYLYAGDSIRTTVAEVALHDGKNDEAIVGRFVTQRDLRILDFTRTPVIPSVFEHAARQRFSFTRFVDAFVDAITAGVYQDDSQAVSYAPTQVMTEALRWLAPRPIDGIAFPSHAAKGGKNYALFFGPGEDFATEPPSEKEQKEHSNLWRTTFGPRVAPTFVLARGDVTLHKVSRNVRVTAL